MHNVHIKPADFNTYIDDVLGERGLVRVRFFDAPAQQFYDIRLQRQMGQLLDHVDCQGWLDGRVSYQLHRTQSPLITVGQLLLIIAGATLGSDATTFFAGA